MLGPPREDFQRHRRSDTLLCMGSLLPIAPDELDEVDRFLADPPHVHLYLRSRLPVPGAGRAYVYREEGEIRGVALFGSGQNLVLAGDSAGFARQLAVLAGRTERSWVMVVGRFRDATLFLEDYLAGSRRRPRLDRAQAFYVQTPDTLPDLREPELRRATMEDLSDLTLASARMSAEDFELDVFKIDHEIVRRRLLEKIRDGRSWLRREDGLLSFKADLAVLEPYGGQVEGVYTAESRRRGGRASRGMAEIGHRLLAEVPALTLHVSVRNLPAVRAYENAGYVRTDELRLAILPYVRR
jgi:hypothetical protein